MSSRAGYIGVATPLFVVGIAAATGTSTAPAITPPPVTQQQHVAPSGVDAVLEPARLVATFGEDRARWIEQAMAELARTTVDRIAAGGHHFEDWIAALADAGAEHIPDLRMLRVDPIANTSTSGFGWREDPFTHNHKFHHGADIKGDYGTPVVAAGDGLVVFAGDNGGYGNVIYVDHGGGVITRYAHLRKIEVKLHATVAAGQRIGQVGATGHTTGPHLHFEVRLDGASVDPTTALMVARLERESPSAGQVCAHVLVQGIQSKWKSEKDPPKDESKPGEHRPERAGHVKREKPLS
jgi:murein DD-endopeptidase MepM/ murein hydrolase activator NlpD